MKRTNQRGFAVIEAVLIILILGTICGTGYYIYKAQHQSSNVYSAATKESSAPGAIKPKPKRPVFKFDNLGVQFTLPASLKDLHYSPQSQSDSSGTVQFGYLTTDEYKAAMVACGGGDVAALTPADYSFAGISRHDGKFNQYQVMEEQLLKQFPSFYVTISYPNGTACRSGDSTQENAWTKARQAASTAFAPAFKATAVEIK